MGVGNADAFQDQNDLWPNNLTREWRMIVLPSEHFAGSVPPQAHPVL